MMLRSRSPNDCSRRDAVAAVPYIGGLQTDLTPAAHPLGREPLKMSHTRRSRCAWGSAQSGGFRTFGGSRSGDKLAPKPDIGLETIALPLVPGADAPRRVLPAAGAPVLFGRRTWSGDPCCETLAKTRPIGLKRRPAYPAGRNGRCGRNLGGDCQRRGDAAWPFLVARSAT